MKYALGVCMWLAPLLALHLIVATVGLLMSGDVNGRAGSFIILAPLVLPLWVAVVGQFQACVLRRLGPISMDAEQRLGVLRRLDRRSRYLVLPARYGYRGVLTRLLSPTATPTVVASEDVLLRSSLHALVALAQTVSVRPAVSVAKRLVAQYTLGLLLFMLASWSSTPYGNSTKGLLVLLGAIGWWGIRRIVIEPEAANQTSGCSWPLSFGPQFWRF